MPTYSVNLDDIEDVVRDLQGEASYTQIYESLLVKHSGGKVPNNYKDMATFQATVRRKVENHCPEYKDYDSKKYAPKFRKISRGTFCLIGESHPVVLPGDFQDHKLNFELAVEKSTRDTSAARKARLKKAPTRPKIIRIVTEVFLRNADVVAEVLQRASGFCERCKKPAPFLRKKDATPYLEVHHRIQLANGGEDTEDNAIALCPNCHRELHFGEKSQSA
ncbi:HNH endonuclease [Burkholderia plantarii]|uniref:HNH endonuclease n=1 Tax=Burkholderia plantarii TaxID=41899 RepID=UPI00272B9751|nr:HNH endonuclease signature motif containing protein [Burkholderia plantarii]WLE60554.1 HNH endonuclease [Burkholderia plantarii]